jgi:ABC-type antimicrobial peptide transport system permease subunit
LRLVKRSRSVVATGASNARFATLFMASFGIVAIVLMIAGVHGVIGYDVVQPRQEFGVRRALGAGPRDVLWLIVRTGLRPAAAAARIEPRAALED